MISDFIILSFLMKIPTGSGLMENQALARRGALHRGGGVAGFGWKPGADSLFCAQRNEASGGGKIG